jgi:hypothetical protein
MYCHNIAVEEGYISEEEWARYVARREAPLPAAVFQENRGKQPAVPDNPSMYMTRLQLSRMINMENFGWELYFIRRANPAEGVIVMHLPRSGQTAVIEKDGSINMAHGLSIRSND